MVNSPRVAFISAANDPWGAEHSLRHILVGIQERGIESTLICKEGPTLEFLHTAGAKHPVTLPRGKSRLQDLWLFFRALLRSIPAGSKVVVFSLDLLPIAMICQLTVRGRSFDFVADIHDNPTKWTTRRAVSFFLRFFTSAIVISEYVAPLARSAGTVHVVPRPIGAVVKVDSTRQSTSQLPVRVGVVGRIDAAKRLELAVEAVARMSTRSEIHIFGAPMADSTYFEEIQAFATKRLGVRAKFWGHQKLEAIYSSIDILFVGNENEPSGRTVGEALSWGVPVVVPDSGGAKEFIVNGESGLIYTNGDALAASNALERLASNPSKRAAIGQAGRAKMAKERSVEKVASRYLNAIGLLD